MKLFKRLFIILLIASPLSVFADDTVTENVTVNVTYRQMLNFNIKNINGVKTGMDTSTVIKVMKNYQSEVKDGSLSNPWKIEKTGNTEVYHYLTRRHPPFTPILEHQATPVIFVNGKVTAIGRNFLRAARNNAQLSNESTVVDTPHNSSDSSSRTLEARLKTLKDLYKSKSIDKKTYDAQVQKILDSI